MDFKQLQTFVQVAELGSFTRAAHALQVAQPALSRQVRALEVELRQSLFARNGRGVTLTEAGTRLLAHARGILQQVERARHDLADPGGASSGLLSIGLPPSISRTLTAPLVEAFRARFPRATLSVLEGLSNYTLEWLVQGRIDCAVVYNATPSAAVELRPVLEEQLFLVSARPAPARRAKAPPEAEPAHATLADVAAHGLVIPSRPHAIRMRLETVLALAGLKPSVALEIESVPAILELVRRHALHAVLSRNALRASGHEGDFIARTIVTPPRATPLATTLWIATSAQRPQGPLLARATTLLAELLRRGLGNADTAAAETPAGGRAARRRVQPALS
ncbi:MAG: LysR substrate-binding domain-containing protein [Rubrivivax sp.]|nr:LysR substrate-binding domain-containing protein [Rubrivivax sp.]